MTIVATAINDPTGTSLPVYSAQSERQSYSALLSGSVLGRPLGTQTGYVPQGIASASFSGSTASISAFALIADVQAPVATGAYIVTSDGVITQAITPAHATLDRLDAIYVQIGDDDVDHAGSRAASIVYQAGTAGSGVISATVPARSFLMGVIAVPHGGGTPVFTATQQFCVASGGLLPMASAAQRDALITRPYNGFPVYRIDTDAIEIYNGTGWDVYGPTGDLAAQVGAAPNGNVDSGTTAGTVAGWFALGSVPVPPWATQAIVTLVVSGVIAPPSTGNTRVGVQIAGTTGSLIRLAETAASSRFYHTATDLISGLTPGSVQTVRLVSQFVAGSNYRLDTVTAVSAVLQFLP